ncbi:MAG: type I 3-dehydroquinate dehydratase [Nitrososphaerota archaeon]
MKFKPEEKICVSIAGKNFEEVTNQLEVLNEAGAKLVEMRLDFLIDNKYLEVLKAASNYGFKIVSTVRCRTDGGVFDKSEEQRKKILLESASIATYVDVEYDTYLSDEQFIEKLKDRGSKILLSKHFFEYNPNHQTLIMILERMKDYGDLYKIITSPKNLFDANNLLSLYKYDWTKGRLIAFCMGEQWAFTRLLSIFLGAPFTYAHNGNSPVASGQLSFIEVKNELEKLSWLGEKWHFSQ